MLDLVAGVAGPGDERVARRPGRAPAAEAKDWEIEALPVLWGPAGSEHRRNEAPVVGRCIHNDFTTRLRLETLASLGGFGVGSAPDLSGQLTTLLSRFTDPWLVSIGHRLFAADDDQYDVQMHGGMLGIGYCL